MLLLKVSGSRPGGQVGEKEDGGRHVLLKGSMCQSASLDLRKRTGSLGYKWQSNLLKRHGWLEARGAGKKE